jgi:preprotein translocase subunit SecD
LSDTSVEKFSQLTARMVGRRVAIAVDSIVFSAPLIQDRITDGRLSIVMYDTPAAPARLLAATISSGPLEVSWRVTGKQP